MENHLTPENTQLLLDIKQSTIYLMGASFVLGSMCTLFLLLTLDFIRRNKTDAN